MGTHAYTFEFLKMLVKVVKSVGIRDVANQKKNKQTNKKRIQTEKKTKSEFPTFSYVYSDISRKENARQGTPA